MRSLALLLLGGFALLAALTFLNVVRLEVNATLPPVSKNLNTSVWPLADARWAPSDIYNVTYYGVRFVPGWPELYTVGYFVPRDPGWSARLEVVGRSGAGQYAISLGGQVQITESQDAGPPVPIAGATPLDWQILATQRFSILARAWFSQGGATAVQLINFTAEPMSRLYEQTFSCPVSTFSEQFNYCFSASVSLLSLPRHVVTLGPDAWVSVSGGTVYLRVDGPPSPSPYGVASLVIDMSSLGFSTHSTISMRHLYGRERRDTRNNLVYIQIQVRRPDGSVVYLYLARDDGSSETTHVYDVMGGAARYVCNYIVGAGGSGCPAGHIVVRLGALSTSWATFFSGSVYPYVGYGTIEKIALVAVDHRGTPGRGDDDYYVYWTDLVASGHGCSLPGAVSVYTRGQPNTNVFIDANTSPTSPPSLATQVDAHGASNNPSADWGAAIAVYRLPSPVPAYGTAVSVWGRYVRDAGDARNNVAYLSIGVDTDGDGQVDREHIIYRYDTVSSNGAIVSAFFRSGGTPVYVCTVDSAGTCTPADPRFVVVNAGSMTSGGNYQWSYTLYEQGAVAAVAFVATDNHGYASGTADDFWVYWDDLTIEHSACPPPAGWSVDGRYAWQSYSYLLVTGSATAYRGLVDGALTYVAELSGVGMYAVFDSSLNAIFGVSASGSSLTALCGAVSTPLGSLPAARYVELRPLNGLGDIIVRDQYGAILARYSCRYTAAPQYVGFGGGLLKVHNVTALG
ncbi:MAG: hypothetical protein ACO2PN_28625 [Pyrobaculum sp.]|jgi:hypothetical protein